MASLAEVDFDHIADGKPGRRNMDRLQPRRFADQLAVKFARSLEQDVAILTRGCAVERKLLLTKQGLQGL